jgi:hypothetical protein
VYLRVQIEGKKHGELILDSVNHGARSRRSFSDEAAPDAAHTALRRAGIQGLRAGRVRFSFSAPAGVVRVSVAGPVSPRSRAAGPVLATGTVRAGTTSNVTARLRPTAKGRVRLRRARRITATLRVTVTPTNGAARTRTARTLLHR